MMIRRNGKRVEVKLQSDCRMNFPEPIRGVEKKKKERLSELSDKLPMREWVRMSGRNE